MWVKDETGNVAGSHKARHLVGDPAAPAGRRAALGVGGRARARRWPSRRAATPRWPRRRWPRGGLAARRCSCRTWADPPCSAACIELGATVDDLPAAWSTTRLATRASVASGRRWTPAPCRSACRARRTRSASTTGRTIGWEMVEVPRPLPRPRVRPGRRRRAGRLRGAWPPPTPGIHPRLHAVQAEGCAPLARAWARATSLGARRGARRAGTSACGRGRTSPARWPTASWTTRPTTGWASCEGIDGERWLAPSWRREAAIVEAHDLAGRATGIPVSATGTAGLAGLLAIRDQVDPTTSGCAVIFTGRSSADAWRRRAPHALRPRRTGRTAWSAVASAPCPSSSSRSIRASRPGSNPRHGHLQPAARDRIVMLGTDVNDDMANHDLRAAALPRRRGAGQGHLAVHQQPGWLGHRRHGHLRHDAVRRLRRGHDLHGPRRLDGPVPAVRRRRRASATRCPTPAS